MTDRPEKFDLPSPVIGGMVGAAVSDEAYEQLPPAVRKETYHQRSLVASAGLVALLESAPRWKEGDMRLAAARQYAAQLAVALERPVEGGQ